jgi:hypothetical protein
MGEVRLGCGDLGGQDIDLLDDVGEVDGGART